MLERSGSGADFTFRFNFMNGGVGVISSISKLRQSKIIKTVSAKIIKITQDQLFIGIS